jgi:hypothetical protein
VARKGIGVDRDDIIRMAREAFGVEHELFWMNGTDEYLERFATLVAAEVESNTSVYWYEHFLKHFKFQAEVRVFDSAIKAEREACALEVEKAGIEGYGTLAAAAAIRARGDYGL